MTDHSPEAFRRFCSVPAGPKIQQEPDDQCAQEDGGTGFFQIAQHFLPHVDADGPVIRQLIFRQLDEQIVLFVHALCLFNKMHGKSNSNCHQETQDIHGVRHDHGRTAKEHFRK